MDRIPTVYIHGTTRSGGINRSALQFICIGFMQMTTKQQVDFLAAECINKIVSIVEGQLAIYFIIW